MTRKNKTMLQHHVIYDRLKRKVTQISIPFLFQKCNSIVISFQTLSTIIKYITNDFHL